MKSWLSIMVLGVQACSLAAAGVPLRFEVEKNTEPGDVWSVDGDSPGKGNLLSKDKDADKGWSGSVVLVSPRVRGGR